MIILQVFLKIKPEMIEDFKAVTIKNARNSIKEPGIFRFDFIQQEDNPLSFVLIEVYKDNNAVLQHKETAHYAEWRKSVEDMMSEPRKGIRYFSIFPDDSE